MADSMIESIRDFICTCPFLADGRVHVDYTGIKPTEYSIDGTPITKLIKSYIGGGSVRQYAFVFRSVERYGSDALVNISNSGFYEDFGNWLEEQTKIDNLPKLGEGKTPWSLEAQSTGYLFDSGTDTAYYQIQCRLIYFSKGGCMMGNTAQDKSIMRHQIADYLNIGEEQEEYSFMGAGYNTLDENPSAQTDGKIYISNKAQTNYIKSYQTQFPFDTDLMKSETTVMALYDVGRNQKTGAGAEKDYVRVELFRPIDGKDNTYMARKFRVSVEVSGIAGGGGETVKVTGNLNNVGDFVDGEFNTVTKTFTASSEAAPPTPPVTTGIAVDDNKYEAE